MNTSPPHDTVAVIIAAYNAEKTIQRAIQSALSDSHVTEVIIVDDASIDQTVDVVKKSDDGSGRLKIFKQDKNQGPSAARNRALQEINSGWITILDADDFFLSERVKGMLAFADGYGIVADDMYQVPEDNIDGPRETLLIPPLQSPQDISLTDFVLSNVTKTGRQRGELGFIKPLIKRSLLVDHKISYQNHMRLGEDYELYVRLLASGARMILVPAQGYVSVRRENSLSGQHAIEDLKHLRDCNQNIQKDFDLNAEEGKALRAHYLSVDCRYQWRCLIEVVKKKNIKGVLKTFMRPYPVPFYLLACLGEQVYVRAVKKITGLFCKT